MKQTNNTNTNQGENEMTKFKTGTIYSCTSPCDHNCKWTFTIIKRTAKSVWIVDTFTKEIIRKVISVYNNEEQIFPLGKYSMCPILGADDADDLNK